MIRVLKDSNDKKYMMVRTLDVRAQAGITSQEMLIFVCVLEQEVVLKRLGSDTNQSLLYLIIRSQRSPMTTVSSIQN